MRTVFVLIVFLCLAGAPVRAQHLGAARPDKPVLAGDRFIPRAERVGGDTIASALPIPELPFADTGNTGDYYDDYDETCPYDSPGSPDVVYSLELSEEVALTVDLCGSSYDTKVYIYDAEQQLLACNDDYYYSEPCGNFVSRIDGAIIASGQTVFIVVDGYGGEFGDYSLEVTSGPPDPCPLPCPPAFLPEGEPPLADGYIDEWNGGCDSELHGTPFQVLNDPLPPDLGRLCGVSGWYVRDGFNYRDTDWFEVFLGGDGEITLTLEPQYRMIMFEMWPQDCFITLPEQYVWAEPCELATMTITGSPQTWAWMMVCPAVFEPPVGFEGHGFDYLLWTDDEATTAPDPLVPAAVRLLPVHPNPFNPRTTVSFELARSQRVAVVVYDLDGRRLAVLVDEVSSAGAHSIAWNGCDGCGRELPSGGYLVRLEAEDGAQAQKVTLVR